MSESHNRNSANSIDRRSSARRRLLKTLAAGGSAAVVAGKALPSAWQQPAIDSVVLPVHAQVTGLFAGSSSGSVDGLLINNLNSRLLNMLTPEAVANGEFGSWMAFMCATPNGNGTALASFDVVIQRTLESRSVCVDRVRFRGTNIALNAPTNLPIQSTDCFPEPGFVDADTPSPLPFISDAVAGIEIGGGSTLELTVSSIGASIVGELVLDVEFFLNGGNTDSLLDLFVPKANALPPPGIQVTFPVNLDVGACSQPSPGCELCEKGNTF